MRIHEQNKILKEKVKLLEEGYDALKFYLHSEKFHLDEMVHKNDILARISEIQSEINLLAI